jgi:ABC-2 type transport system permease protein
MAIEPTSSACSMSSTSSLSVSSSEVDALVRGATTHPVRSGLRVTRRRIAYGEWVKLRSVRSTVVTMLGAAFATVFLGAVFAISAGSGEVQPGPTAGLTDPVAISLSAITITQLIVGVVGVLVVAGEYSTGLIRSTFAATGSRLGVMWGKAAVVAVAVGAVMAISTTAAIAVGQTVYAGDQPTVALSDPVLVRVAAGATLYLVGVALLGVALGFLLRSTAGAIGSMVAWLFIGPNLLGFLPDGVADTTVKFMPSKAGESMMTIDPGPDLLSVTAGLATMAAWVVALLALAAWQLRRRDA